MEKQKKIIIAIDGFSSTGKSTVAKHLANELGYVFVDTGAMYRAVTFFAIQNGYIDPKNFDKEKLINNLYKINLTFEYNPKLGYAEIFLNGVNVEKEIGSQGEGYNREAGGRSVSYGHPVFETNGQLVEDQWPVLDGNGPFFGDIQGGQIK